MSDAPKPPTTSDLLVALIEEIRGLRSDIRSRNSGLPDARIGKSKKHPEYEGKQASECPPDVLLDYAEALEWKVDKNRSEGKLDYVARDERTAILCRRWAVVNKGIKAPERTGFRRAEPKDDAPDTQDSARGAAPQPTTETRPKWGGGSGWSKKAGGQ